MVSEDKSGEQAQPDVERLVEQIKEMAHNGLFREAESLREQLMETNPMAINSIVSSAEIIETEKTRQLDPGHMALWAELYDGLSSEDTNCLFYSLKRAQIDPGKRLLAQGQPNNRLFFLQSGRVTLYYRKKEKNYSVCQLTEGDIMGEDSFFGISLCPFSAATQSEVEVWYLNRKIADQWRDSRSGLHEALADFCKVHGIGEITAEQKSSGRRDHRRYPLKGSATAHLLDLQGERTTTYFKGELADMSRSGVCFSIRCSRQQTARALLSKEIDLVIAFDNDDDKTVELSGAIVKLSYHLHSDYSVHVKFSEILDIDLFKRFPCDWSAEEKL